MSAILVVIQHDKVHLMSDGAFYDEETGILSGIDCKVRPIPGRMNAAYSSRGIAAAFPLFEEICEARNFQSFDDLTDDLQSVFNAHDAGMNLFGAPGAELVIVGWSEARNRPEVYARQMVREDDQIERGRCYRWIGGRVSFGVDWKDVLDSEEFEPIIHALPAFEKSRVEKFDLSCGKSTTPRMGYAVGGGVFHVEIGADGRYESGALYMWPDVIGEPIDPFRDVSAAA